MLDLARQAFCALHDIDRLSVLSLLALGTLLHPVEEEPEEGPSVTVVTHDAVRRMLEWTAVSAHRSVTLGAWLRRLATSRIRWVSGSGAPRELTLDVEVFESVSEYDRVSVVLSELRRILRDGRDVEVLDADGTELDAAALAAEFARF